MHPAPASEVLTRSRPTRHERSAGRATPTFAQHIVQAAALAPSPDNNQPWYFVWQGGQLLIQLDLQRTLPSDANQMFDLIGLGAAIENAAIAAQQRGYEAEVRYLDAVADGVSPSPVATMSFDERSTDEPLAAWLGLRCTCRSLYATKQIPMAALVELDSAARRFGDVDIDWVLDRPRINALAPCIAATDLIRLKHEPFHRELFKQLRLTRAHAEQSRDGLDVRTLALPPGGRLLLRWLRSWPRTQWLHRIGLGRLLSLPTALAVRRSGALGLISVSNPTPVAFLRAGRTFQRLWLAATAAGLALQPMGSPAIFFAHLEQLGGSKLSPKHARTVARLRERFRRLVPRMDGSSVAITWRMGYAPAPRVRSLRRLAADVSCSA